MRPRIIDIIKNSSYMATKGMGMENDEESYNWIEFGFNHLATLRSWAEDWQIHFTETVHIFLWNYSGSILEPNYSHGFSLGRFTVAVGTVESAPVVESSISFLQIETLHLPSVSFDFCLKIDFWVLRNGHFD